MIFFKLFQSNFSASERSKNSFCYDPEWKKFAPFHYGANRPTLLVTPPKLKSSIAEILKSSKTVCTNNFKVPFKIFIV